MSLFVFKSANIARFFHARAPILIGTIIVMELFPKFGIGLYNLAKFLFQRYSLVAEHPR